MVTPRVDIDLAGINENAEIIKKECNKRGIEPTGVVKGGAGDLEVFRAFTGAGLESIGDSRLQNIVSFRKNGYTGELVLLRLPRKSEAARVVKYADISLNSEIETVRALSRAACKQDREHQVIIMVDVGDLREGVLAEDLTGMASEIMDLPGITVLGVGTNVGCYGGVLPTRENTEILLALKEKVEKSTGQKLTRISGGNTATTILFEKDRLPSGINNLRIGEAILQGTDVTNQREIDYLNQDNFVLVTEVVELKEKPSVPWGNIGHDAFGHKPEYEDKGLRKRAILAVGRQDVKIDGLTPFNKRLEILGASSDHLLIDVTEATEDFQMGSEIKFRLDYGAMLSVMTSSYVKKKYI